jgi:hypothetical protein
VTWLERPLKADVVGQRHLIERLRELKKRVGNSYLLYSFTLDIGESPLRLYEDGEPNGLPFDTLVCVLRNFFTIKSV